MRPRHPFQPRIQARTQSLQPRIARPRVPRVKPPKLIARTPARRQKTRGVGTKMMARTRGISRRRPGVGTTVKAPSKTRGAAVVKAKYMSPGRTAGYAAYMTKDKAEGQAVAQVSTYMQSHGGEGPTSRAELFTKAGEAVDLDAFTHASHHDPRVWTLIVSPQQGSQLDMAHYTQAFMQQLETDTGRPLDWIAAVHTNTPHHHAHILLRGRDLDGQDFRLDPEYLSHGLRHRAIEVQEQALSRGWVRASTPTPGASTDATLTRLEALQTPPAKSVTKSYGMEW